MRINLIDISWGWSGSSSGGSSFARKTKITSRRLWMVHNPTGIRVDGEVPSGHYSKKEMKQLTEDLKDNLLVKLEQKVLNHGTTKVGRGRPRK